MLIQRAVTLDGTASTSGWATASTRSPQTLTPTARGGRALRGGRHRPARAARPPCAPVLRGGRGDSIRVGPPQVRDRAALAAALANAEAGDDGWIRAVGYHDSVAGELDRDKLDALNAVAPTMPLRIQHRSGALWILNSAGLARVGLAEHPDGRLRSTDPGRTPWARSETNLADLSQRLSRDGVTGITDATPDLAIADVVASSELHRRGEFRQHVHFLSPGKRSCTTMISTSSSWPTGLPSGTATITRSPSTA